MSVLSKKKKEIIEEINQALRDGLAGFIGDGGVETKMYYWCRLYHLLLGEVFERLNRVVLLSGQGGKGRAGNNVFFAVLVKLGYISKEDFEDAWCEW